MLGAIIGDIVGSRWEFNTTNDYHFELFSEKNDFTDDTICTIAVADALLRHQDFGETIHAWCRRYPYPMGSYGGRFYQWVMNDHPQPYKSFGNGSAMRVSPVAWFYTNVNEMIKATGDSAACTHNHPEGIKGAQAVAMAIHDCRELHAKYNEIGPEEIRKGLQGALQMSGYDINIEKGKVQNRFDETCPGTVPVAFWIIMGSTSFEDAIRKAVSLGADADTLGAIVGSIAEAIWGIPQWIKERAISYLPDDMKEVLTAFRKKVRTTYRQPTFTPERITELKPNEIFVFGSNLAGMHGGGAARIAMNKFGAIWGQGVGLQGQSYAIPTMQGGVETIKPYVDEFISFAKAHPEYVFLVTKIGCGIAGFSIDEIAPLFTDAKKVKNIVLPEEF